MVWKSTKASQWALLIRGTWYLRIGISVDWNIRWSISASLMVVTRRLFQFAGIPSPPPPPNFIIREIWYPQCVRNLIPTDHEGILFWNPVLKAALRETLQCFYPHRFASASSSSGAFVFKLAPVLSGTAFGETYHFLGGDVTANSGEHAN